jgi:hypothetical protein
VSDGGLFVGRARKLIESRTVLQNIRPARRYVSQQLSHPTFTQKNYKPQNSKTQKVKKVPRFNQKPQNFSELCQSQKGKKQTKPKQL